MSDEFQKCRRAIDNMIDFRKSQRPHDQTEIRVLTQPKVMHRALHPGVILPDEVPHSCLFRGYRIVSIPGEKAAVQRKVAPKKRAPPPPPPKGEELRDAGIEQVLFDEEEWRNRYARIIALWFNGLPDGATFSGEILRHQAKIGLIEDPHHPNAWGGAASACIRSWLRDGLIEVSGMAKAANPGNHAHTYREYRKL